MNASRNVAAPSLARSEQRQRIHRQRPLPDTSKLPDEALLTRQQIALLAGFSEQALKLWAKRGRGPRVTTIEGRPRYRVRDVRAWMTGDGDTWSVPAVAT